MIKEQVKFYLDVLAKLATIGGVVLAILAFNYTVLPVFNKHKLEKEIEKLKDDKSQLAFDINNQKDQVFNLKYDKRVLEKKINKAKNEINELVNENKIIKLSIDKLNQEITTKKEEKKKLQERLTILSTEAVSTEWKLFLNTFIEKNFDPNNNSLKFVLGVISKASFDLNLVSHTKEQELVIKDNYPYSILIKAIKEVKYSDNFNISHERFKFFKKYLTQTVQQNRDYFYLKRFPIELKQKLNNKILILKKEKNVPFSSLEEIQNEKVNYYQSLESRRLASIMIINKQLSSLYYAFDDIPIIDKN